MSRDNHDLLIDQLLREVLGGDRPRDISTRVLAQAKIIDRFRRRRWLGIGSAIAASIALAAGLVMYWPHPYPNPTIDDLVEVPDGGGVDRGTYLVTDQDTGNVKLGGYVDINMAPQTALTIGGSRFQERVLLNQGQLDVDVTKHKGQFDIAVGPTTVHVTGTRFRVKVGDEETATAWVKKLYVAVKEGSVEVQNLPNSAGTETITTGQEKSFPIKTMLKGTNGGPLAAAQQGARIGARGGLTNVVPRVVPAINPQPSNPQALPPQPSALPPLSPTNTGNTNNRPVQLLTTPATANRIGRVLHTGNVIYLETRDGNFFMFEQSTVAIVHPEWLKLSGDQYTRVVWADGAVSRLEKYTPPATTTAQPK